MHTEATLLSISLVVVCYISNYRYSPGAQSIHESVFNLIWYFLLLNYLFASQRSANVDFSFCKLFITRVQYAGNCIIVKYRVVSVHMDVFIKTMSVWQQRWLQFHWKVRTFFILKNIRIHRLKKYVVWSYDAVVTVSVKEPVYVTKNKWCWDVPPRCTDRQLEYRIIHKNIVSDWFP